MATKITKKLKLAVALIASMTIAGSCVAAPSSPKAFPEAEGYGAGTPGGRGGRIIEVTNLNASGPGSFRAAVEASGSRIVVFRVGGIINLKGGVNIVNPYLTVAGQTAPGGGILIRNSDIHVYAHNVVFQYLRIRPGYSTEPNHGLFIRDGSHDVIIDHCSLSWATDENLTVYSVNNSINNVTVSNSIIGEGIAGYSYNDHAAGAIVGSVSAADKLRNISIHHNLFIHNQFRNPYIKGKSAEVINNLTYNWMYWSMLIRSGIAIDIVGNYFKLGPSFKPDTWTNKHGILWSTITGDNGDKGAPGVPSIYIAGNKDGFQTNPDANNWKMIQSINDFTPKGTVNLSYQRLQPMSGKTYPITVHHVNELERVLLPTVGASRRLDNGGKLVPNSDSVDTRLLQDYKNGTGKIISHQSNVGGYPQIASGTPYPDIDRDGMSDVWESKYGLASSDPKDGNQDKDGDGYTNVEEFLNGSDPTMRS